MSADAFQSLNLTSYIASVTPETRSQLYGSPWTCQAVFRALEPLARWLAGPIVEAAGSARREDAHATPRKGRPSAVGARARALAQPARSGASRVAFGGTKRAARARWIVMG